MIFDIGQTASLFCENLGIIDRPIQHQTSNIKNQPSQLIGDVGYSILDIGYRMNGTLVLCEPRDCRSPNPTLNNRYQISAESIDRRCWILDVGLTAPQFCANLGIIDRLIQHQTSNIKNQPSQLIGDVGYRISDERHPCFVQTSGLSIALSNIKDRPSQLISDVGCLMLDIGRPSCQIY